LSDSFVGVKSLPLKPCFSTSPDKEFTKLLLETMNESEDVDVSFI